MSASSSPSDTTPGDPTSGFAGGYSGDGSSAMMGDPGSANPNSLVTPNDDPSASGASDGGTGSDNPQPAPVTIDIGTQGSDTSPDGTSTAARAAARVNHRKTPRGRKVPGKGRRRGSVAHSTHRGSSGSHAQHSAKAQHHTNAANHHAARAQQHAAKAIQHGAAAHKSRPAPHPASHPSHQTPPIVRNNGGAPAPHPAAHHAAPAHHSAPKRKHR